MALHTFQSLAKSSKQELDRIMVTSPAPTVEDVLGFEFRGWNLQATTKILGTRKFKKGFFGRTDEGYGWGYNMPVEQNAFEEPWIDKPDDDEALKRYYFFKVFPGAVAKKPKYPKSLVIDYREWDEYFALNPVRYTVDYLVYPDPDNPDLILGKSYLETGLFKPFLGYFVLERHNESDYGRDSHFLSKRELRTVEAFAEIAIPQEGAALTPTEVMWNIDRQLERITSNRVRSLKLILFVIEYVLPRRSLWPFRRRFSKMKLDDRRQFIQKKLADPRSRGILRDLAKIRTLFASGYYGDPRVYLSIGFVPPDHRPKYQPDKLKPLGRPALKLHEPGSEEITCDVCVIGSGAGGAVVASNAAKAGKAVVLIEEGPYVPGTEMTHDEGRMTARLYKEGGLQTTVDLDLTLLQGQCLGGTTVINNLICFRLNDPALNPNNGADTLDTWDRLGAHINRPQLNAAFARVEQMIGMTPLLQGQESGLPGIDGSNAGVMARGWDRLVQQDPALARLKTGLFAKNMERCLGCGYCNFGCPYERKLSMLETYIPEAIKHGARVIAGCKAREIETSGGRTTGVRCERHDGRTLRIRAANVVVACGAIGSSVLLMRSGVKDNVGKRFSFNAGTPVFARFLDVLQSFDGVQMARYIDGDDYLLETLYNPPMTFAVALPGWFEHHAARMQAYGRFASAGVLIGTEANARVKRTPFLRNTFGPVDYKMTDADLGKMKRGIARMAHLYFAAGAEAVYPATFADHEMTRDRFASRPDEIQRFIDDCIKKPEDLTLSSAHLQGGNAMSDDRAIGVVDSHFRVHGYENLYVCDASVFPTTIRINPQLTIMAMADYFSHLNVW